MWGTPKLRKCKLRTMTCPSNQLPDPILPSPCCGAESEIRALRWLCGKCGSPTQPPDSLPSIRTAKTAIWGITNDVEYIELVKEDVGFINDVDKELDPRICYWILYMQIRRNFEYHKHAPIRR